MKVHPYEDVLVAFPAIHRKIGDLLVVDDGHEITVHIGSFTHYHYNNYDETISELERAEDVADDVVTMLKRVFSDEIEFYDSRGRGYKGRGKKNRNWIFQRLFGRKKYVWSGPVK